MDKERREGFKIFTKVKGRSIGHRVSERAREREREGGSIGLPLIGHQASGDATLILEQPRNLLLPQRSTCSLISGLINKPLVGGMCLREAISPFY